jgi:hypothetical protein
MTGLPERAEYNSDRSLENGSPVAWTWPSANVAVGFVRR